MDKVAVSRAVASLLKSKRIVRQLARADRRRSLLQLSGAGRPGVGAGGALCARL